MTCMAPRDQAWIRLTTRRAADMPSQIGTGQEAPSNTEATLQDPSLDVQPPTRAPRFRPCIATMSIGHPTKHSLLTKLRAAAHAGFEGIELYWDDLAALASTLGSGPETLTAASTIVRLVCDELGLNVVSLQPFRDFDGLEEGPEKEARLREFDTWLACASKLRARIIGVPASISHEGRSPDGVVADIALLADLAARNDPPVTIAYEALCFSAFNSTWQRAWEVVSRAGRVRPNVGILMDTFNVAGAVWSDPCREGGLRPDRQVMLSKCLDEMAGVVTAGKVALVQVADAELLGGVDGGHGFGGGTKKRCLRDWSRNCRLFPMEGEFGGHMPVVDILGALTRRVEEGGVGYEGWISMEVFTRSTEGPGEVCVEWHVERAWASWVKLRSAMGWE